MPPPAAPRQGSWAVYVHFPWCLKRCAYCDFATSVANEIPRQAYCDAVIAELAMRTRAMAPAPIASVFFGGGTPSLWGDRYVGAVLQWLDAWGGLRADAEVSLEANPGAAEHGELAALTAAGINRISAGIQSLHPAHLRWLDRVHDAGQAAAMIDKLASLLAAGRLRSASCDLIYGVPGQTAAQVQADVQQIVGAGIPHLSAYSLTVEAGTPLHRRVDRDPAQAPDDELQLHILEALPTWTAALGVQQYEVSNFARTGHRCRHNLSYWTGDHYLAVGVGAHGFLPHADLCGQRYGNVRSAPTYLRRIGQGQLVEDFRETIDAGTHLRELVLTGLRLQDGLAWQHVAAIVGDTATAKLRRRAEGMARAGEPVQVDGQGVRVRPEGVRRLDSLIATLA